MENSVARCKTSTFLPFRRQAVKCQASSEKSEADKEEINFVETLPRMIDKLHIDESTEENVTNDKLIRETAGRKEIMKCMHNLRSMTIPSYDIDGMTTKELQTSLYRVMENVQQPFSFLADISRAFARDNYHLSTKARQSTDIDIQLATVAERIRSCKTLLEEAKSCNKDTIIG